MRLNFVSDLAQVQGSKVHYLVRYFSGKIHLKKFVGDFCFVIKITNCRSVCATRGIGAAKIFDWGEPNHKSQVMTSSEIFERGTFCGTKIFYVRESKAVACVFGGNQNFAIRRELKSKIKNAKV